MKKNPVLILTRIAVAVIFLYCFLNPNILASGGFSLAIDGLVVARTGCLIFSLVNIISVIDELTK